MSRSLYACLVVASLVLAGASTATPITVSFTGTVASVGSDLAGSPFSEGQAVSGSFTFESSTADGDADPDEGLYLGALTSFSITIGAYSATGGSGTSRSDGSPAGRRRLHGHGSTSAATSLALASLFAFSSRI
jgi:hypothetical protein